MNGYGRFCLIDRVEIDKTFPRELKLPHALSA